MSRRRCNDFNVEFVNVCLFILLNALVAIKLNSGVHCQYLVSFAITDNRQKENSSQWSVTGCINRTPGKATCQRKIGQHIMNSIDFIADVDLEFCHESTYQDVYQRTGIF